MTAYADVPGCCFLQLVMYGKVILHRSGRRDGSCDVHDTYHALAHSIVTMSAALHSRIGVSRSLDRLRRGHQRRDERRYLTTVDTA